MNNDAKAIVLYYSVSGNTQKVARSIFSTVSEFIESSELVEIKPGLDLPYLDYNLIFLGTPVYHFLPPKPAIAFLESSFGALGGVVPATPEKPDCAAVVFCTYAGGHTGSREAVPCLTYIGQHFEHAGIRVVDHWAVVGAYPPAGEDYNKRGRLGDIAGRPNESDLKEIMGKTFGVMKQLGFIRPAPTDG
ncbi:MAG: hypothetical protein J7M08_02800 [Planctomycetes bacterium]|nr:hypothetical protein [Planctomycetota bacterium]